MSVRLNFTSVELNKISDTSDTFYPDGNTLRGFFPGVCFTQVAAPRAPPNKTCPE